jgi:hypothetical protein
MSSFSFNFDTGKMRKIYILFFIYYCTSMAANAQHFAVAEEDTLILKFNLAKNFKVLNDSVVAVTANNHYYAEYNYNSGKLIRVFNPNIIDDSLSVSLLRKNIPEITIYNLSDVETNRLRHLNRKSVSSFTFSNGVHVFPVSIFFIYYDPILEDIPLNEKQRTLKFFDFITLTDEYFNILNTFCLSHVKKNLFTPDLSKPLIVLDSILYTPVFNKSSETANNFYPLLLKYKLTKDQILYTGYTEKITFADDLIKQNKIYKRYFLSYDTLNDNVYVCNGKEIFDLKSEQRVVKQLILPVTSQISKFHFSRKNPDILYFYEMQFDENDKLSNDHLVEYNHKTNKRARQLVVNNKGKMIGMDFYDDRFVFLVKTQENYIFKQIELK